WIAIRQERGERLHRELRLVAFDVRTSAQILKLRIFFHGLVQQLGEIFPLAGGFQRAKLIAPLLDRSERDWWRRLARLSRRGAEVSMTANALPSEKDCEDTEDQEECGDLAGDDTTPQASSRASVPATTAMRRRPGVPADPTPEHTVPSQGL